MHGLGKHDEALAVIEQYFPAYLEQADYQHGEELFQAHYLRGILLANLKRYADALQSALLALSVRNHAHGWLLAAEMFSWIARAGGDPLASLRLTDFCGQQAIDAGNPRTPYVVSVENTLRRAALVRCGALIALGDPDAALGVIDYASLFGPHESVDRMRERVAAQLKTMV